MYFPASPTERRRWPVAALAAIVVMAALALATAANAQAATIDVNPVSGSDGNNGSIASPLKTLGKALSRAHAGDIVQLAAGGYGQGPNGTGKCEQFPAGGLVVPARVTIQGATSNGFPAATLLGQGSGAALTLAGSATIHNLAIGGDNGFAVGCSPSAGRSGSAIYSSTWPTPRRRSTAFS